MKKFEYKVIIHRGNSKSNSDLEKDLNELGLQGWELVSSMSREQKDNWQKNDYELVLKRESEIW
jgi:Domain of unknown function (DUF4177)